MKNGEAPEQGAAIWYALVQRLRYLADYYERDLVRQLRFGSDEVAGLTWAQVAEAVDSNLGGKQAAYQKWKRLVEPTRRPAGAPGRGGWPKGRPRSPETPTPEES